MRFHVHAASCQLSSRPLLAGECTQRRSSGLDKQSNCPCSPPSTAAGLNPGLFSLALLVLISHLGGPNPRRLALRHDKAQATATPDLYTSSLYAEPDPEVVARLLETLVTVPEDEVGQIAICASLRNEGRFMVEWLLYVSRSALVFMGTVSAARRMLGQGRSGEAK